MPRAIAAILLVLSLAACSGEDASVQSMDDLVEELCWNQFEPNNDTTNDMFGATESGVCDFEDESIDLIWFRTGEDRDQWLERARRIPGGGGWIVGDRWVVQGLAPFQAEAIMESNGARYEPDDPSDDRPPCKDCDPWSDSPT